MKNIFSPERLRLARQRRGLKQQELAARCNVSTRTVYQWENGRGVPKDARLQMLASILGFPASYFFGDAPPTLDKWAFRAFTKMTAPQRDMALAAGAQAIDLDKWLDDLIQRPKLRLPDLQGHPPDEAAIAVRANWGLGYRPLPNTVHLMEANGIRVYSLVYDGAKFDALSVWHGDVPFVFLNTSTTVERRRMNACHEIGHLVLHARTGGGETKRENDEAAGFAAAFLMPADPFVVSAPRKITLPAIISAKQKWGVSAFSYIRRLHELQRISNWQYRSLCVKLMTRYEHTDEPGPTRVPEVSSVLDQVFSQRDFGISRRDAIKRLRIPMSDLDDMTFGLTLTVAREGAKHMARTTSSDNVGETIDSQPELRLVK